MITWIMAVASLVLPGLFFLALIWSMLRRSEGPAPWPLRLVLDDRRAPRFGFLWAMMGVSILMTLVLVFTDLPASPRQQQLDRIEGLLRQLTEKN